MPKKKNPESPEEQSARFVKDAEELISAGKLDPEKGAENLDRLLSKQRK